MKLVLREGFAPHRLGYEPRLALLPVHSALKWYWDLDSNQRPIAYQANVLPLNYPSM